MYSGIDLEFMEISFFCQFPNPQLPEVVGKIPVIKLALEGAQTGTLLCAFLNKTPSPASLSIFGVLA